MNGDFSSHGISGAQRAHYAASQGGAHPQRMSNHMHDNNSLPPIEQLQGQYPPTFYGNPNDSMPSSSIHLQNPNMPISSSSAPPGQAVYAHPQLQTSAHYLRTQAPLGLPLPQIPSVSYSEAQTLPPTSATSQLSHPYFSSANSSIDRLNEIRPRAGISNYDQYGQPHLASPHGALVKNEPEPTHVVGQQGRRGILPSAPGKATPGSVKAVIPEKNEDGKYSCPSCSKTYLHAKHLKRHMLRHTGERPYACKLCKDTFSRSDILKRHFIKCSIRRGVPPDGDHLEGARVHNNRNRLSTGATSEQNYGGVLAGAQSTAFDHSHTASAPMVGPMGTYIPGGQDPGYNDGMTSLSTRSSRSSSLIQPSNNLSENRRSASSLELLGSSRTSFDGGADFANMSTLPGASNSITAYSMPATHPLGGVGAHPYAYQMHNAAHEVAPPSNGMGWGYPASGPEYQMYHGGAATANDRELKSNAELIENGMSATTGAAGDGVFSGLYSNSFTPSANLMFDGWETDDPLEQKAAALLAFCFPNSEGYPTDEESQLRAFLTPDSIKHFVSLFGNFQGHWPMLHMPTFNPATAYDGLLLAIIGIGAIYSDQLDIHQQRLLMEHVKRAMEQSSRIFSLVTNESTADLAAWISDPTSLEELQALILVQSMFSWHGNNQQRSRARANYWKLAVIARRLNLLGPMNADHPQSSVLHCSSRSVDSSEYAKWQWHTWVEQEKRSRALYMIWLMDTAMVIFFNSKPQFDANEIRIQLPCDDAAWEARNPEECMAALGLRGPDEQQQCNSAGSRRARQPEFRLALQLLYDPKKTFQPSSTNIYSKFILIHALHVQIWNAQRQSASLQSATNNILSKVRSGTSTPLSSNDWVNGEHGIQSQPSSGRATPEVNQHTASHAHMILQLTAAVEKWKSIWDMDIEMQYPQQSTPGGGPLSRRKGFCRDAIHFYWLARKFLKTTNPREWQLSADHRFHFVMQNLKDIKNWVASEAYKSGKEMGSVVDIGEEYGIQDLTLDMKLLFAPLPLLDGAMEVQLFRSM